MAAGKARGRDPIIVDTAGRLHTRANLMQELEKIRRIAAREVPGAPHEVLLVLDATVGQNGLAQAREFMAAAGVTGIVLAKLDGTAKGGVAVAIAHDLGLPIRYVGVGEGIEDLVPFSAAGVRRRALRGEAGSPVLSDAAYMERALLLAGRARGRTTPNPLVGAVVVTPDGVVAGTGYHERAGEPHAEVHALREAGAGGPRRDAVLHARALQPRRAHAALRRPHPRVRRRPRRRGRRGSQSARGRPRLPASAPGAASRRRRRRRGGGAAAEPARSSARCGAAGRT